MQNYIPDNQNFPTQVGVKRGIVPIEGKFYSTRELQELRGVGRAAISRLAKRQGWTAIISRSGVWCAEDVEPYLMSEGIDTDALPIRDYDYPDGATWQKRSEECDEEEIN